ncbi:hypothetical protein RQP46_000066 [Phenoliferia psychrophenolica]
MGMFRSFSSGGTPTNSGTAPPPKISPPIPQPTSSSTTEKEKEYNEKAAPPSTPAPVAAPRASTSTHSRSSSLTKPITSLANVFRSATTPSTSNPSSRAGTPVQSGGGGTSTPPPRTAKGKDVDPTPPPPPEVVFDFNRFLEQMRLRSADPIAKYLRSFLKEFSRRPPVSTSDQIKVINDFLDFIAGKMRTVEPWRSMVDGTAGERGEDEFDMAMEAMEKLVMNRLWHLTFSPAVDLNSPPGRMPPTDDLERDRVLNQRIRLFAWLEPKHLDLHIASPPSPSPPSSSPTSTPTPEDKSTKQTLGFLDFAKRELNKINQYKAPRDKLICVLNACKVIFGLIRHVAHHPLEAGGAGGTGGGGDEGADAFVPFLIYVVLKANPDHLVSNLQYIQRFRNPEKLSGEGGYYLSSLNGAISFIETMDSSSLSSITQTEFETHVELAIQNLPVDPSDSSLRLPSTPIKSSTSPLPPSSSLSPSSSTTLDSDSPSLLQTQNLSFPDATKAFFIRSSDSVERIVSKPLGAIGRIFEQLEQLAGENDSVATGNLVGPGGPHSQPPTPTSMSSPHVISMPPPRQVRKRTQSGVAFNSQGEVDPMAGNYVEDGMSPVQVSMEIEKQEEGRRLATLETLTGIFPGLEHEVLEMVLLANSGDMARTIDALLEMS